MAETKMPVAMIESLPGNSNASKDHSIDDRPKQKIIKGSVKAKQPGLGRKFADAFFGKDIEDVKSYIICDVLVPTVKATISDVIGGGIEMLLFGRASSRGNFNTFNQSSQKYVGYGSAYLNSNNQIGRPQMQSANGVRTGAYIVQDLIFSSRGEAEDVLNAMRSYIYQYDGMVSVADMYYMVGVTAAFTDHSWGWTDLTTASIRRVREGYMIVLPRPTSLK